MNDPHVEALHYRFIFEAETDNFDRTEPFSGNLGGFDVQLDSAKLVARPREHFCDERSVRNAFEPMLRSWEQAALLSPHRYRIRFDFDRAEVVDRRPTSGVVELSAAVACCAAMSATVTRHCRSFPHPQQGFLASELTQELSMRFQNLLDGKERLCSVGYAILNKLETVFGRSGKVREQLASALVVDIEVLNVLGDLTAVDDPRYGRKSRGDRPRSGTLKNRDLRDPLTPNEVHWIEAATARLILRVGEHQASPTRLPNITMADLPPL